MKPRKVKPSDLTPEDWQRAKKYIVICEKTHHWFWKGSLNFNLKKSTTHTPHKNFIWLLFHKTTLPPSQKAQCRFGDKNCINPSHLEPVPVRERRKPGDLCKNGHKIENNNLYIHNGTISCRKCLFKQISDWGKRNQEKVQAYYDKRNAVERCTLAI